MYGPHPLALIFRLKPIDRLTLNKRIAAKQANMHSCILHALLFGESYSVVKYFLCIMNDRYIQ